LRLLTPLPTPELAVLKRSVAEISAIGRNLNQIARALNQGERPSGPTTGDLHALLRALNGLRIHIKGLVNANPASWRTGYRIIDLREAKPILDTRAADDGAQGAASNEGRNGAHFENCWSRTRGDDQGLRGRSDVASSAHLDYFGREGRGEIETDDGDRLHEKGFEKDLILDWSLDLDAIRRHTDRAVASDLPVPHRPLCRAATPNSGLSEYLMRRSVETVSSWQEKYAIPLPHYITSE
jgi:hypothetical protein